MSYSVFVRLGLLSEFKMASYRSDSGLVFSLENSRSSARASHLAVGDHSRFAWTGFVAGYFGDWVSVVVTHSCIAGQPTVKLKQALDLKRKNLVRSVG